MRAGTVALVGRPNTGKSTLLNALTGARLAITSRHPQTTRDRILGILTEDDAQYVFVDTPGLHAPRTKLGTRMNVLAEDAARSADVIAFVSDVPRRGEAPIRIEDLRLLEKLPEGVPVVMLLTKIDKIELKEGLFPTLEAWGGAHAFEEIVPISAKKRDGIDKLKETFKKYLPKGDPLYPPDELTDKPVRFFAAEFIREQVLQKTRQEVPHGVAVTIDAFQETDRLARITATIHVDKDSHKAIVIGARAAVLKEIGTKARERIERFIDKKVHLDLLVKATPGWYENEARLRDLGYDLSGR